MKREGFIERRVYAFLLSILAILIMILLSVVVAFAFFLATIVILCIAIIVLIAGFFVTFFLCLCSIEALFLPIVALIKPEILEKKSEE
jgi:hypothetical protein